MIDWRSRVRARQSIPSALAMITAVAGLTAPVATAADFSARDVSVQIFQAKPGVKVDLSARDLTRLDLSGLDFRAAGLSRSDLFGADLSGANLSGSDLSASRLDRTTITNARFDDANLEGATLLRPSAFTSLVPLAAEAPSFRRANMKGMRVFARLTRSDLSGADLSGSTFAPFGKTGFIEHIWRSELSGANLTGAMLANADMTLVLLSFADLSGANLRGAVLRNADLTQANFTGADLTGVDVAGADLYGAVLKGAQGLETLIGLDQALNADKAIR